jgi:O-antigen/teichoic acid export membrane protein
VSLRIRTLLIGGATLVRALSALAITILVSRMLTPAALGTYQQAILIAGLASMLLLSHLAQSLYYFLSKEGPEEARAYFFNTVALILGLASLSSLVLLALAGPAALAYNNPELVTPLRLFALWPVVEGLLLLLMPTFIALNRPQTGVLIVGFAEVLKVLGVLAALFLDGRVEAVLAALLVATGGAFLVGFPLVLRARPPGRGTLDRRLMWVQLVYTLPIAAATFTGTLNRQLDRLIMGIFYPPEVFAVYALGALELPLIGIVSAAIGTALLPDLVRRFGGGDRDGGIRLWGRGMEKSALVLFPATGFFLIMAWDFMEGLYGAHFRLSGWPFAVYLLRLPLRVLAFGTLWRAVNETSILLKAVILAVIVNAAVSLGLLWAFHDTPFGLVAPAVGTVLATVAAASWQLNYLRKTYPAPIPWAALGRIARLAVVGALSVLPCLLIPGPALLRVAVGGVVMALVYGLLVLRRGLVERADWQAAARVLPGPLRRRLTAIAERIAPWDPAGP